ncbi:hypothetical protein AB0L56_15130, partial [Streptomyces sp. NPDC052079]|uniref:hypothetical protein n=1 Tax=Streptomyces sp. NPDC052079 TaxID=3155526 RepID=UPI003428E710
AVCDTVTVLRDGRRVHHGRLAELDRLSLVSTPRGREWEGAAGAKDAGCERQRDGGACRIGPNG